MQSNQHGRTAAVTGSGFSFLILSPLILFFGMLWLLNNEGQINPSSSSTPQSDEIAPLFTSEVQAWQKEISKWAQKYELDPDLIATVMQIESCGDPQAQSSAGARGLFQVMPFHFTITELPFNPNTNAKRGLKFLKSNLEHFGDISLTLAAYNGGPGTAAQPYAQWPQETQRYIYWGEGIYNDATQGKTESVRLNEWLNAGGASLCK